MSMMCDDEDDAFNHIESMNRVKKAFDEEMKMRVIAEQKRHDDMRNEVIEQMQAFAKLVAEKEREACAEVCKKHADVYAGLEQNPTTQSAWAACIDNRDAIRARGQV